MWSVKVLGCLAVGREASFQVRKYRIALGAGMFLRDFLKIFCAVFRGFSGMVCG